MSRLQYARTLVALMTVTLAACGGGSDGAQVSANPQSVTFGAAPSLTLGGTATVSATASSGLAVTYSSATPAVCGVDGSGLVTGLAGGTCTIAANQAGNASWAPAPQATQSITVAVDPRQTIAFGAAPALTLGGAATVSATASSGLPVTYGSLTPAVCSVNPDSGLVTDIALGDCIIAADQGGDGTYHAALRVTQTLSVAIPSSVAAPGAPAGVAATLGSDASTVIVTIGAVDSGGSAIVGYTVVSTPPGITATSTTTPVTVACPSSCAGHAFSVYATNAAGQGIASNPVDVITVFDVTTTFREPDTQPRDSIFTGSFTLNSTTGTVAGLAGRLTESMTGNANGSAPYYDMTQVSLTHQLQVWRDAALGGTFVASFARNETTTFSSTAGGEGWSPKFGIESGGVYAGFPAAYGNSIQNAYALIFVPDDPYATLSQAQLDKLAYADCAPGGMMGAVCMTGTSIAGYGSVGTMSGYPVAQVITKR